MTGLSADTGSAARLLAPNPFMTTEFIVSVSLLILVLLAGAVAFFFIDRWRKQQLNPQRESTDSLTTFRTMFERGELTEAEYRKVRDRVAARMREEIAIPAVTAESTAQTTSPPLTPPPEPPGEPPTTAEGQPPPENPSG